MFKLMTDEEATYLGFSHHGSYYGVPIYLGWDARGPAALPKSALLLGPVVWLMRLEALLHNLFCAPTAGVHRYRIGDEI